MNSPGTSAMLNHSVRGRVELLGDKVGCEQWVTNGSVTLLRKVMAFLNYVTCLPVNNTKRTCWIMFDFPTHDEKDRLL